MSFKKTKGKRKGPQNKTLIKQLEKNAIKKHYAGKKAKKKYMDCIRDAGESLYRLRYETDNLKKMGWRKYILSTMPFSVETANNYIRIYKKRDDPRITKARENNISIDSIAGFLRVLRGQADFKAPEMTEQESLASMARQELRQQFAEGLRCLCWEELDHFEVYFDEYWEDLYKKIYKDICLRDEQDLNEYLYETGRLEPRKRKSNADMKNMSRQQLSDLGAKWAREDHEVVNKMKRREEVIETHKRQTKQAERTVKALTEAKDRRERKKRKSKR